MNLRRIYRILILVASITASTAPVAYSQLRPGMGPRRGGHLYNPSTETTVKGTVQQVITISPGPGREGIHLDLKTESGIFDVHVGPAAYLAAKKFKIAKGDHVNVIGSKVSFEGHDAIIARELKKGGNVLILRDAQGIPQWSGPGRRFR